MSKTLKKTLSIILAILMIASVMPMAYAADESHTHAVGEDESVTFIELTKELLDLTDNVLFLGNYYLTEDLVIDETLEIRGFVNICFNGYRIVGNMEDVEGVYDPAISVSGSCKLAVCDCKGTGGISNTEGGILLYKNSEVNMYGGNIIADINDIGEGVRIADSGATFNMYGGKIYATGRGINVGNGTANLYGGTVGGDNEACYVSDGGVLNNSGATICDHLCHQDGILGIVWIIVGLIYKLFKLNPACECGAAHY